MPENEAVPSRTNRNTNDGFLVQGNILMPNSQNEQDRPQGKNPCLWTHCPTQNRCRTEGMGEKETKHRVCGEKKKHNPMMETDDRPQEEEAK